MAAPNSPPGPRRTIVSGSASSTARGVTFRSRATSSMTAPGFSAIYALSSANSVLNIAPSPLRGSAGFALAQDDVKSFELGMAEVEAFTGLVVGAGMGTAELFRFGPGFERRLVGPDCIRRVQCVILGDGSLEQVKLDKAGHVAEIGFARAPDGLESRFRANLHLEPVHCDKHLKSP